MEESILELKKEIYKLSEDVKSLIEEVKMLSSSCKRMDEHISFINKVYTKVRNPFSYVLSRLNFVKDQEYLPEISS